MTKRTAGIVVTIASLILGATSITISTTYPVLTLAERGDVCEMYKSKSKYKYWVANLISWIDLILYALLPALIIVISNSVIVRVLANNKMKQPGQGETSVHKSFNKIVPMLLLVSTFFVICTLPVCISIICEYLFIPSFVP